MRYQDILKVVTVVAGLAAVASAAPNQDETAVAIFAGGCFWCMEPPYDQLDGVLSTTSGYTGGSKAKPSYKQVSSGRTKHREAVRIEYDPKRVGYGRLLEVFWRNIDPLDGRGQFCDKGRHYTSAIYALDDTQLAAAKASKAALESGEKLKGKIRTEDLARGRLLPGGRLPSGLLHQEPHPLQVLPLGLRPGCAPEKALGRGGSPLSNGDR